MHNTKICFKMGIASFFIGFLLIVINYYWIVYGIAFLIMGILNMCLYKNDTYLKVAGMIYITLTLFAGIGTLDFSHMFIPSLVCAVYGIVFLKVGLGKVG